MFRKLIPRSAIGLLKVLHRLGLILHSLLRLLCQRPEICRLNLGVVPRSHRRKAVLSTLTSYMAAGTTIGKGPGRRGGPHTRNSHPEGEFM